MSPPVQNPREAHQAHDSLESLSKASQLSLRVTGGPSAQMRNGLTSSTQTGLVYFIESLALCLEAVGVNKDFS